jgi:superfamily I DNA and/or RNA helicase
VCLGAARRYNRGEAQAALAHAQRLLAAGLAPSDIGIITPYSAQVAFVAE